MGPEPGKEYRALPALQGRGPPSPQEPRSPASHTGRGEAIPQVETAGGRWDRPRGAQRRAERAEWKQHDLGGLGEMGEGRGAEAECAEKTGRGRRGAARAPVGTRASEAAGVQNQ